MTQEHPHTKDHVSAGEAKRKPSSGRNRLLLRIAGAIAIIAIVVAWQANLFKDKVEPGTVEREQPDASHHELTRVETTKLVRTRELLGSLRARGEAHLAPRVSGRVLHMNIDAGDPVTRGQIIAQLERDDLQAAVGEADAAIAIAEADLRGAEEALKRVEAGFQNNVASEVRLIEATRRRDAAAAALEKAREASASAASRLEDATVRSPIDGIVIDTMADEGDLAMPGRPLAAVFDPDRIEAQISVPASLTRRFEAGVNFPLLIEALDLKTNATVRTLVQRSEPRTRSSLARLRIPTVDGALPGMFVRLLVETGTRDALTVPSSAIGRVRQLTFVWRATDDDSLQRRLVNPGAELPNGVTEILSGLEAGDRVVTRWIADPKRDPAPQRSRSRPEDNGDT